MQCLKISWEIPIMGGLACIDFVVAIDIAEMSINPHSLGLEMTKPHSRNEWGFYYLVVNPMDCLVSHRVKVGAVGVRFCALPHLQIRFCGVHYGFIHSVRCIFTNILKVIRHHAVMGNAILV